MKKFVNEKYIEILAKQSEVYFALDKHMTKDIYEYKNPVAYNNQVQNKKIIWMFWWQGEENMPKLVKRCFKSIENNKPKGYEIILLSEENYRNYVEFPKYIMEKFYNKQISIQHFSDLLRTELLYIYGGTWIDATVYCCDKIPDYMLENELFFFHGSRMDCPVIKLSSWWISANKGNRLLNAIRNFFYNYWEIEDVIIDYFLYHIVASRLIEEDVECNRQFRAMPYFNNSNAHVLVSLLYDTYSPDKWGMMREASLVQKLTYKEYRKQDTYSFYDYILE